MAMGRAETRDYAKEMMLEFIDRGLASSPDRPYWDADDREALLRQRNRTAHMLGQPPMSTFPDESDD